MLNQIVLVGRLTKTPELQLTETGKKTAKITLAVPRSYKNINGEYETDFLDCTLWTNVAENTTEYCQTGDMIGVRGRVQTRVIENEDGTKKKKTEIIAEKVTFLATAPKNKSSKKQLEKEFSEEETFDDEEHLQDTKKTTKDKNTKKAN